MAEARSAGRMIARNTLFGVGAQMALKVVSLLFQIFVVRQLGGEKFGQYNQVLAWAGLFSVLGDVGVVQYLQREVASNKKNIETLFWDTVMLRVVLAVMTLIITVGGAMQFTDYSPEMIVGLVVFTLGYFFQTLMIPLYSVLSGSERIDITSIFAVLQQVFFMIMATIVLILNLGFVWLLVVGTLNLPIMLGLHIWAARRNNLFPSHFQIAPRTWLGLLRAGIPFGLVQLSLSFAFRADQVLLNHYHVSDLHLGWYAIAYINLTLMVLNVTTSFNNAILPTLAREHSENPDSVKQWYYGASRMLIFIGLPVAVGGMVLAEPIMRLLYPKEFPAFIPLMIVVWDIPFYMYHSFCGNITITIKREMYSTYVYGSLGIANIVLNLALIPSLGIIGSSFATVLTDLLGAMLFYVLFRRVFGPGLGFSRLARLLLAAVLMGAGVYLVNRLYVPERGLLAIIWLGVCVAVGAVIYLAVAWTTGALTLEERTRLSGFALRRLGLGRFLSAG